MTQNPFTQPEATEENKNKQPDLNTLVRVDKPAQVDLSTLTKVDKGFGGHLKDIGTSLMGGLATVPDVAVGLADIVSNGRAGKFIEDNNDFYKPGDAAKAWAAKKSDVAKSQQQQFADADGITDKTLVALKNPSMIANTVVESVPSMVAGALLGRGAVGASGGAISPIVGGAIGEGAVMAGAQAEQIRQKTDDRLLSDGQVGAAAATGVLGGLFGLAGGKLANKLGIGDIDTMLVSGRATPQHIGQSIANMPAKSIPRKVIEGAITEGFLEELPQSVSEQILQNLALDKEWSDGVEDAAVMGTLAGMAMGAGASAYSGVAEKRQQGNVPPPNANNPNNPNNPVNPNGPSGNDLNPPTQGNNFSAPQGLNGIPLSPVAPVNPVGNGNYDPAQPVNSQANVDPSTANGSASDAEQSNPAMANFDPSAALALLAEVKRRKDVERSANVTIPSEQMGINPNDGPMSAAAALAVDSGASTQMANATQAAQDTGALESAATENGLSESSTTQDTERTTAQDIERAFNDVANGASEGTRDQVAEYINNGNTERLTYSKPDAVQAAINNPNYNVRQNEDGSATVLGVKTADDIWHGLAPDMPIDPTTQASLTSDSALDNSAPDSNLEAPQVQTTNDDLGSVSMQAEQAPDALTITESGEQNAQNQQITTPQDNTQAQTQTTEIQDSSLVNTQPIEATTEAAIDPQAEIAKSTLGNFESQMDVQAELSPIFSKSAKANEYLRTNELADTHEVAANEDGLYEVRPKTSESVPASNAQSIDGAPEATPTVSAEPEQPAQSISTQIDALEQQLASVKSVPQKAALRKQISELKEQGQNIPVADAAEVSTINTQIEQLEQQFSSTKNTAQKTQIRKQINKLKAEQAQTPAQANSLDVAAHRAATSPQNNLPEPTQAQKEAGNYAKGHVRVQGLDITIENPRGSDRAGMREDGTEWRHTMSDHYGYIKKTTGADNEHIDTYIGSNPDSQQVYVVDQLDQLTGKFDEHKVMLGFDHQDAAIKAYQSNFDEGWKVGPIRAMSMDEFKIWLKDDDTTKPATTSQEQTNDAPSTKGISQSVSESNQEAERNGQNAGSAQPAGKNAATGTDQAVGRSNERSREAGGKTAKTESDVLKQPEPIAQPQDKIEDFGEKIGGARKDSAINTGSKSKSTKQKDLRPTWAKRFEITQIVASSNSDEVGRWVIDDTRKKDWKGNPKRMGASFATQQEAEEALVLVAVGQKHRVIASRNGSRGFEIWRNISDRKGVKVVDQVFTTRDEALRYMVENAQSIIETNTTFGEIDLPRPDDTARKGVKRRTGAAKDIDFIDIFGFRGVEFGNWNNQEERQQLLNDAYDGLMDLADVLDIPPKALSLNGDLALAFGARGQGLSSARAHYEPEKVVINLTKMNGAGSLAHEWWHAFDHYLARQDGKASGEWIVAKDGTRSFKISANSSDNMVSAGFSRNKSGVREDVREAYNKLMQTIFRKSEQYVEDTVRADDFVGRTKEQVVAKLTSIRKDLSEQKDVKYYKRHNKPASAEQLVEFDTFAQQIMDGVALDTELRASGEKTRSIMSGMRWTNDALEKLSAIYKAVRGRSGFSADQKGVLDSLRSAMNQYSARLKMLADAQSGDTKTRFNPTEFAMSAKELDQGRGTNYWTTPHEMIARAFQGYVEDQIAEKNGSSPFLNYAPESAAIMTPWGWKRPYPHGSERTAINRIFDKLVDTLETKETSEGTALFSHTQSDAKKDSTPKQVRQKLVERFGESVVTSLEKQGKLEIINQLTDLPADALNSIMAFHGSPYKFDKFSLEHLGRGDGHQLYGHGLYFSDSRAVSEFYRKNLAKNDDGQLYQVDIDSDSKDILNWEDSLTSQKAILGRLKPLQEHLQKLGVLEQYETLLAHEFNEWNGGELYTVLKHAAKNDVLPQPTIDLIEAVEMGRSDKAASLYLHHLGINGLKYAQSARDGVVPTGSSNYVIFDDSAIQIVDTFFSKNANGIEGYYHNGKVTLVASNLTPESVVPTFLHELGGHAGFQNMMSKPQYNELMRQFDRMVEQGNPIAVEAQKLAMRERNAGTQQLEMLPYLLSLAANPNVKNAIHKSAIKRFIADLISKVKAWAFDKLGVNLTLTPNDMVALAERMVKQAANGNNVNANSGMQFSNVAAPAKQIDAVRKQYENTKNWLKAPNGKPTNLTEKQWLEVRTPAFKQWFGDWENDAANASKVVDANGEPMVMYHGTNKVNSSDLDFTMFDTYASAHGLMGQGSYFTDDMAVAQSYTTKGKGVNPRIYEVHLNIRNPLNMDALATANQWAQQFPEAAEAGYFDDENLSTNENFYRQSEEYYADEQFYRDEAANELVSGIEQMGFDGVTHIGGGRVKADGVRHRVYIALHPNQIKSATDNNGDFDVSNPDILFSRGVADSIGDALKNLSVQSVKDRASYSMSDWLKVGLPLLGRRQLAEIYNPVLPQLNEYNRLAAQMDADQNDAGAKADNIVRDWSKLKDEQQLAELMHDATLAQIDPAKPRVPTDNVVKYNALRKAYDALAPDAKDMYTKARDAYASHYSDVHGAIKERILRSELSSQKKADLMKQMDANFFGGMKGVYFPLARFGMYTVIVRDTNGDVESVSRAETMNEAQTLRADLIKRYPNSEVGNVTLDKDFSSSRDGVSRGFMAGVFSELDNLGLSTKDKAEFEDTLNQLYLSSLPDLSWAKHGIHRKGTPGFSQNARRAFAQNMFHGASYLSKLRYGDQLTEQLDEMQKYADGQAKIDPEYKQPLAQRVINEMNARHENMMNPKPNALSSALTSFGFLYFLGLSPASAMVNIMQTPLVAFPVLGAKWGFNRSSSALLKASNDYIKGMDFENKTLDIAKGFSVDEKAAYDQAVSRGVIDVTQAHDLAGIAQGEDSGVMWKTRPIMRAASFMFHHAERFNREVTFIAAYRLAKQAGVTNATAYEQAVEATYQGHFDYSAGNRPRIMQGNAAKVLFLFKQFGQNMMYLISRQAYQSFKGKTAAERLEARKMLSGILVSHALAAGVLGLPMVTTILAVASMFGGGDDEPWDAEVALRNYFADLFGADVSNVLMKGASRATPIDISGRVGLDNMILPRVQDGLEGQRLFESVAAAALGPVAGGIGINIAKGAQQMGDGRYKEGLTEMLPVFLKSPMKSYIYANEGVQDKTGVTVLDEVSSLGVASQAIGFSPSKVRTAMEGKSAIYQADKRIAVRRKEIMAQWVRAKKKDDKQAMDDLWQEAKAFNEANPKYRITRINLMQSYKGNDRRIKEAENGVYLPRNKREIMERGRFAFDD